MLAAFTFAEAWLVGTVCAGEENFILFSFYFLLCPVLVDRDLSLCGETLNVTDNVFNCIRICSVILSVAPQEAGVGELVAIAWGITLFVFVGLTLFVAYSDIDFSFLGLFLPVCLLVFVFWGLTAMIFGFKLGYVYAAIGALLFSAYIIYDTFNSEFILTVRVLLSETSLEKCHVN